MMRRAPTTDDIFLADLRVVFMVPSGTTATLGYMTTRPATRKAPKRNSAHQRQVRYDAVGQRDDARVRVRRITVAVMSGSAAAAAIGAVALAVPSTAAASSAPPTALAPTAAAGAPQPFSSGSSAPQVVAPRARTQPPVVVSGGS